MKIFVCGQKDWNNYQTLISTILEQIELFFFGKKVESTPNDMDKYLKKVFLIHDGETAVSKMATEICTVMGIPKLNTLCYKAKWGDVLGKPPSQIGTRNNSKYWKAAGFVRNAEVFYRHSDIDVVLIFHNDATKSKTINHIINLANKKNIKTLIISQNGIRQIPQQTTLF